MLFFKVNPDVDANNETTQYNFCMNDEIEEKKVYCKQGVCIPGWKGKLCSNRGFIFKLF